ncbi:hypothetical protein BX616_000352 [Lobosporangium transversale]|nr:hypothetical protein BX616_000352 [Lobosporangium transversale]
MAQQLKPLDDLNINSSTVEPGCEATPSKRSNNDKDPISDNIPIAMSGNPSSSSSSASTSNECPLPSSTDSSLFHDNRLSSNINKNHINYKNHNSSSNIIFISDSDRYTNKRRGSDSSSISSASIGSSTSSGSSPRRGSSSRRLRTISHQSIHVRLLRLVWSMVLLMGEHGVYWVLIHRCSWPENSSWDQSSETRKEHYRIALIADPQLTDWMSYHQSGLLLALVEIYTDIFMRRSFKRLHASLRPDAVIFLGDLLDGGRTTFGKTFDKNKGRFFERVFITLSSGWNQRPVIVDLEDSTRLEITQDPKKMGIDETAFNITGHYQQLVDVPLSSIERERIRNAGKSVRLYVAGNHDVGFGDKLVRPSMVRYKRIFGSVNYEIKIGNHSLVVLDTLALSSELPDIRQESQQFLSQLMNETPTLPRILFTHIPLYRIETTPCGAARETKQLILDRMGEQYQNMIHAPLTQEILQGIQPDMVFSGDDHDWCEVAHAYKNSNVKSRGNSNKHYSYTPEVTLPTFSFAQGIQQPGFVMLSLYNPDHKTKNLYPVVNTNTTAARLPVSTMGEGEGIAPGSIERPFGEATFAYEECMLPNQLLIYLSYGLLFVGSLGVLLIQRHRWMARSRRLQGTRPLLAQWRKENDTVIPPKGSTTATAFSSPPQDYHHMNSKDDYTNRRYEDDDDYIERDSFEYSFFKGGEYDGVSWRKDFKAVVYPLRTSIYWKMVGWDLWNIARYMVPFYVLLFAVSFI